MTLKVIFKTICVLFFFVILSNKGLYAADPGLVVENNEVIKKEGFVVGRLDVSKDIVKNTLGLKKLSYKIKVYDSKNALIAVYKVLSGKKAGNIQQIYEADLKTMKDRVMHAGSNFLDYNEQKYNSEDGALQTSKLVNYLFQYRYI